MKAIIKNILWFMVILGLRKIEKKEWMEMDVITAIKTRRSIGKVKPDSVSKEMIETILEAGTWAPCHHQTEPWRFFVLTGDARKSLGNIFAQIAKASMSEPVSEEDQKKLEREQNKPLRAPVIITVAVEPS